MGTSIIPAHKFKANFIEYFEEYIKLNKREGNRHFTCCLAEFNECIKSDTGLRWVDVKNWNGRIFKAYTNNPYYSEEKGKPVTLTLHPIVPAIQ